MSESFPRRDPAAARRDDRARESSAAGLQVHLLRFRAEVIEPIRLPDAAGAALRGALFGTLRRQFCVAGGGPGCGQPPVAEACPVCFLLAPVDEAHRRGRDVPRPYNLRGVWGGPREYAAGQTLEFGLATVGRALRQFPYTVLGIEEMGKQGLGARRSGTFQLDEIWAENPLLGRQEAVYVRSRERTVYPPSIPVDESHVAEEAARLAEQGGGARLEIELLAPTRLVDDSRLVKADAFAFRPFVARLLERVTALWARYGDGAPPIDGPGLIRLAEGVDVVERRLMWRELFRASGRHGRMLPMSGLIGRFSIEGDLAPFLPWLVWGSLLHVGKDAVMGNGQYRLRPLQGRG